MEETPCLSHGEDGSESFLGGASESPESSEPSAWVSPAGANRTRAGRLPIHSWSHKGRPDTCTVLETSRSSASSACLQAAAAQGQAAAPAAHGQAGPPYAGAAHGQAHRRARTRARPRGGGRRTGRRMHRPAHGQGLRSPSTRAWSQARASQPPPPPHIYQWGGRLVSGVYGMVVLVMGLLVNLCPGFLATSSPHPRVRLGLCFAAFGRVASTRARKPSQDGEKGPRHPKNPIETI
ncbi:hypothetical protein CSUB_C0024 [Candidatus Caldarchaeum subterraneum]|uniref:Uncharacterized protein n=1 Tax=Caldiarchaeum subterraneum TaxID=311458 RepID=E6P7I2_CALS0|nr:hypothetical protein CSUB_C0024 [Candidatus Caldarchaeum subterraneum]